MSKMISKIFVVAIGLCLMFAACVHEPVTPGSVDTEVSFKDEILPLLESACAITGCHIGNNPPEGVNLTSYLLVIETAEVKAGTPGESDLYEVLVEDSPSKIMPPGGPMPASQIELIKQWIEQGAKDN